MHEFFKEIFTNHLAESCETIAVVSSTRAHRPRPFYITQSTGTNGDHLSPPDIYADDLLGRSLPKLRRISQKREREKRPAPSTRLTETGASGGQVTYRFRVSLEKDGNMYFIPLYFPKDFCEISNF